MANTNIMPELIIFSLEYVLIPGYFERNIHWPCIPKNGTLVDTHDHVIKYFLDVPEILEKIKKAGINIAVTYNYGAVNGTNQIINHFGWNKYFKYNEIYPALKIDHLKNIQIKSNVPYKKMIFFDSERAYIYEANELGILSIYVPCGLTHKVFDNAFKEYELKQKNK